MSLGEGYEKASLILHAEFQENLSRQSTEARTRTA